jgi:type IV secretory pathway VirB6-like protein
MNQYAIFTLIWMNVAVPVNGAIAQMIPGLMAIIGTPFKESVIAYFVMRFLVAAWTPDEDVWLDCLKQLALAAVIYALATNAGTFNYYVTNLVQGLVNGVSTAIAGAFNQGGPLNADGFDIIGTRAFAVGLGVFKNLPWYSPKIIPLGIICVVYWFLAFAAITIMFSVYLVSYVATAFLIGVGPLFVALYFFSYTRGWFDGWLRNLMTGVLVQIFTVALGSMFVFVIGNVLNLAATGMIGTQVGQLDGGAVIGEIMMLVVTALACLIFGILSLMMLRVAESIAGGVHSEVTRLSGIAQGGFFGGRSAGQGASGSAGPAGAAGAGSPSPAGAGAPSRSYAFNTSVGSAP